MATYVTLYNLTEQGIRNIKDAPQRIEDGIKAWEATGGRLIGFYSTMGEYDYVAISEAEDDEAASAFALALGAMGNVRTTTMRAHTVDEFARIVAKIPDMG
jgi:uncharacterized protein with GYD domain